MEKSGNVSGHLVQGKLSRGLLHVWATADKHVSQFEKDFSAYYVSLKARIMKELASVREMPGD